MRIPDGAAAVSGSANPSAKAGHWETGKAGFGRGGEIPPNVTSQKTCFSLLSGGYASDPFSNANNTEIRLWRLRRSFMFVYF